MITPGSISLPFTTSSALNFNCSFGFIESIFAVITETASLFCVLLIMAIPTSLYSILEDGFVTIPVRNSWRPPVIPFTTISFRLPDFSASICGTAVNWEFISVILSDTFILKLNSLKYNEPFVKLETSKASTMFLAAVLAPCMIFFAVGRPA